MWISRTCTYMILQMLISRLKLQWNTSVHPLVQMGIWRLRLHSVSDLLSKSSRNWNAYGAIAISAPNSNSQFLWPALCKSFCIVLRVRGSIKYYCKDWTVFSQDAWDKKYWSKWAPKDTSKPLSIFGRGHLDNGHFFFFEMSSRQLREETLKKLTEDPSKINTDRSGKLTVARAKTSMQLKRNSFLTKAADLLKKDSRNKGKNVEIW